MVGASAAVIVADTSDTAGKWFTEEDSITAALKLVHAHEVKQLIFVINLMDHETATFDDTTFNAMSKLLIEHALYLTEVLEANIKCIPASSISGDNIVIRSVPSKLDWYKGPTLVEALDSLSPPESPPGDDILRI